MEACGPSPLLAGVRRGQAGFAFRGQAVSPHSWNGTPLPSTVAGRAPPPHPPRRFTPARTFPPHHLVSPHRTPPERGPSRALPELWPRHAPDGHDGLPSPEQHKSNVTTKWPAGGQVGSPTHHPPPGLHCPIKPRGPSSTSSRLRNAPPSTLPAVVARFRRHGTGQGASGRGWPLLQAHGLVSRRGAGTKRKLPTDSCSLQMAFSRLASPVALLGFGAMVHCLIFFNRYKFNMSVNYKMQIKKKRA